MRICIVFLVHTFCISTFVFMHLGYYFMVYPPKPLFLEVCFSGLINASDSQQAFEGVCGTTGLQSAFRTGVRMQSDTPVKHGRYFVIIISTEKGLLATSGLSVPN